MKKRAGARDDAAIATAAGQPDDDLAKLKRCLEYEFADAALLAAALTHPSLPRHRAARRGDDFERLEFLGDRVLSLVVADWLFGRFPDESEGDLAKRHAELVRRDSLALVATAIGLDGALRLARGEAESGGAAKAGILADAFEAVLGALYRDGGLEPARRLIVREFAVLAEVSAPPRDAKTLLQEWTQGRARGLPEYRTVSHAGPAHRPHFVVEVTVVDHPPARGEGASKRAAEQAAAAALLTSLDGKKR